MNRILVGLSVVLLACALGNAFLRSEPGPTAKADLSPVGYDWQIPNAAWMLPFKDEHPIYFVNRSQNAAEWDKLPAFWNSFVEKTNDPVTSSEVQRRAVKIKVPLGLTHSPPVPAENAMTVGKWRLGKELFFDSILSSDMTVSCSSCHDPKRGFSDRSPFSTGIRGNKGGMSAPTVYNSAFNAQQFWDGRATSLEDQVQGPVQNALEMFDGDGHAWNKLVERVRSKPEYVKQFKLIFGTEPTRDAIAKAIATYERTVLSGNSIHDRAELAMRVRVEEEESGKFEFKDKDYAKVLKEAFITKDTVNLTALGLDAVKDEARIADVAKSINNGRAVFFNKARCSACHVGDNFTDNSYHNLGVGTKDGKLPESQYGRYASLPTGHKNPAMIGAFKTPTLRHLLGTAPYLHDGSEATLEKVVEFYDKGGNVNPFLDPKMRDYEAEKAYLRSIEEKKPAKNETGLTVFAGQPVAPLKLKLTDQEKKDLVMFLRALQGDEADTIVSDPSKLP